LTTQFTLEDGAILFLIGKTYEPE